MNRLLSIAVALTSGVFAGGCVHSERVAKKQITPTTSRPVIPAATVTYSPPKVRADAHVLAGYWPSVECDVVIAIAPTVGGGNEVIRTITMEAKETRHGGSRVSDSKVDVIYRTSSKSLRFADGQDTMASVGYNRNRTDDIFRRGGKGLVREFRFIRDTRKREAGVATKVTVAMSPIRLIEGR